MLNRLMTVLAAGFALAFVSGPALAENPTVAVPEPASLTLLAIGGAGAFGAYAISKWRNRK